MNVCQKTQQLNNNQHLQLPDKFELYSEYNQSLIIEYLNQLTTIEIRAYGIAMNHLGSSFNLLKSNGFCDWLKEKQNNKNI